MPDTGEAGQGPQSRSQESDRADGLSLPTEFRARVDTRGAETWVHVEGELDIYSSPELMKSIEEALTGGSSRVLVSMSLVSFMDSSAISVLVKAQKEATEAGRQLVIHSPSRNVRRTLDLAGLSGHLQIDY
jgi:anti-sigma B factor antagonist